MSELNAVTRSHQPPAQQRPSGCAGSWALLSGHATTIRPQQAGEFRVTHGSIWATLSGPHPGHTRVQGDQFLRAGEAIALQSGQYMVIEPWHESNAHAPTVYFTWAPSAQTLRSPVAASTMFPRSFDIIPHAFPGQRSTGALELSGADLRFCGAYWN